MANRYEDTARVFKALCDPNRIRIIEMLTSGEKCACKLLEDLNVKQPTLSHHMKILCDSGLVIGRKEGKWTHYSISPDGRTNIERLLHDTIAPISEQKDNCCCQ